MAVLSVVLKFAALFLLTIFMVRFLLVGTIGSLAYLLSRRISSRQFDPAQQAVACGMYGLPLSAILISLGSIKALGFLHFGRIASVTFFVLVILFAIRDYADDAISNVARSFSGFLGEVLGRL
jgi:hypothetical protein